MSLVYVIALFLLCYVLLVAEFFVPAGGIIGLGAAAAAIASAIIAFTHSTQAGVVTLVLYAVTTPTVFVLLVRIWPRTSIGRRILNREPGQIAAHPTERTTNRGTPWRELVGKVGVAKTDLLPAGMIAIEGEKLDAVSTGAPIDAGAAVVVASLHANRIRVRLASAEEAARVGATETTPVSPASLETLDLEGLD